jgi:hypothetical protein
MEDVSDLILDENDNKNDGLHSSLVLDKNNHNDDGLHRSLPLRRWALAPADEDEYSDDDWTDAASDTEDTRPMNRMMELPPSRSSRSKFADVI